jgi:hypothetical protein
MDSRAAINTTPEHSVEQAPNLGGDSKGSNSLRGMDAVCHMRGEFNMVATRPLRQLSVHSRRLTLDISGWPKASPLDGLVSALVELTLGAARAPLAPRTSERHETARLRIVLVFVFAFQVRPAFAMLSPRIRTEVHCPGPWIGCRSGPMRAARETPLLACDARRPKRARKAQLNFTKRAVPGRAGAAVHRGTRSPPGALSGGTTRSDRANRRLLHGTLKRANVGLKRRDKGEALGTSA